MHATPSRPPIVINRARLLDRFLRYVKVDTTADPGSDCYPSSEGQRTLGRILRDELDAMGAVDVVQDEHGLVYATIPASGPDTAGATTIAIVTHLDTSPEASGANVCPRVIQSFDGSPVRLDSGEIVDPNAVESRDDWVGKTLIFTDGTTLLGGDDKAGVAIAMELAQTWIENHNMVHGPVKMVMTCDEEIGHGTDKIDVVGLGADVAYTLDGGGRGGIDVETFSADAATVTFTGRNIHPSIGKGKMINALRAAADFISALPRAELTPETTDDRDGFIHPHTMTGTVGRSSIELILRSFEESELQSLADRVRQLAESIAEKDEYATSEHRLKVDVTVRRQYRNMHGPIKARPEVVEFAELAMQRLNRPLERMIVRGGTDGSQLSEKGLPTPNLSSGQYNIHSSGEFACLDDMVEAAEHMIVLAEIWSAAGTT